MRRAASFAALLLMLAAVLAHPARAAEAGIDLILDRFTGQGAEPGGADAKGLHGRVPDGVTTPGGAWNAGQGGIYEDTAWLGGDTLMSIGLGAAAPAAFTIAVDVSFATVSGLDQKPYRGIGLGFWPAGGTRFHGVVLQKDGGLVVINGLDRAAVDPASWKQVAPAYDLFDTEGWYRLSYDVDTATGAISRITMVDLDTGKEFRSVPAVAGMKLEFTRATTATACLYVNSAVGGTYGCFDNFRITPRK